MMPLPSVSARPVNWIALDAVGTLIYADPPVVDVYRDIGAKYGSQLTIDEVGLRFSDAYRVHYAHCERRGYATDEASEREIWRRIVSTVFRELDHPQACFEELFAYFGQPTAWRCFPDVAPVLQQLRQRNFQLAVASNFDARWHQIRAGLRELDQLDLCVISSQVGIRKPSPEFYSALLASAACRFDEMVMVGDDEVNDVVAARAAGLRAVHVCRGESPQENEHISSLLELPMWLGVNKRFRPRPGE